jgi:circadian clock protein KaiB
VRKKADKKTGESEREQPSDSSSKFERLVDRTSAIGHYSLRLYVTGTSARSNRAVAAIRALCEELLPGKYDLEVVDIYQQPAMAMDAQIIAAPTLVKTLPKPLKRFIGNLSDRKRMAAGLNLTGKQAAKDAGE